MKQLVFHLGLGAFFTHELDAMANHEWRVIPLVNLLPETTAMAVFVLAHIPLFALLVAGAASDNPRTRNSWRLGISGFLILHAVLHFLYAGHEQYEFASALSQSLIYGGAFFGCWYMVIHYQGRERRGG